MPTRDRMGRNRLRRFCGAHRDLAGQLLSSLRRVLGSRLCRPRLIGGDLAGKPLSSVSPPLLCSLRRAGLDGRDLMAGPLSSFR